MAGGMKGIPACAILAQAAATTGSREENINEKQTSQTSIVSGIRQKRSATLDARSRTTPERPRRNVAVAVRSRGMAYALKA